MEAIRFIGGPLDNRLLPIVPQGPELVVPIGFRLFMALDAYQAAMDRGDAMGTPCSAELMKRLRAALHDYDNSTSVAVYRRNSTQTSPSGPVCYEHEKSLTRHQYLACVEPDGTCEWKQAG